jgi:hypothetical protein
MIKSLTIVAALGIAVALYLYLGTADKPQNIAETTSPPLSQPETESPSIGLANETDDGTEIVLGLRVRKDRNCEVELKDYVTPDGDMFSAWSCTPRDAQLPHEYAHYDDATLEVMSWSDADAAALLGKRLIERNSRKSYDLLIRATALDNDFGHLAWLADQAFGMVSVNGAPNIGNLERQYELATVSRKFGDLSGRSEYFRQELIAAGASDARLADLDRRVDELLGRIRVIQSTVLGEITIGGQNDA